MSEYQPVTWTELVPITAANLDTMDTGISVNDADLQAATDAATATELVRRDGAGRAKFVDPSAAADAATKNYVDAGLSGTFGVISSGSETANATVAVPAVVGPYVELTVRGSLADVGFLGITVNANTGLGYEWTMGHVRADGVAESYEGTSDTAWIVGRWSTILSVATIRVYGQLGNPNGTASLRFDAMSARHSATTSVRFATHATGRVATVAAMTSIGIASRTSGWGSYDWSLSGFRA